jgi:GTP-binding protein
VVLLLDARRGAMDSDIQVMDLLDRAGVSYGLVLTKADELNVQERAKAFTSAADEAAKHTAALAEVQLTSALSGEGIAQLRVRLTALI